MADWPTLPGMPDGRPIRPKPRAKSNAGLRRPARCQQAARAAWLPLVWLWLAALLSMQTACGAEPAPTLRLQVWFSNDRLNPNPMDCKAVFPVEREVPKTLAVADASLRALFAGPTPAEAAAGYRSVFSAESAGLLKRVQIQGGTAYVDMHDPGQQLSGATASCGAAEFQAQVSRTLQQFPSIGRVVYAFDGQPRAFYSWMNESCGPANDDCDARPFGGAR